MKIIKILIKIIYNTIKRIELIKTFIIMKIKNKIKIRERIKLIKTIILLKNQTLVNMKY